MSENENSQTIAAPCSSVCYTAGPWGIEQTSTTNWIGPLRKDGKVNEIVASTDRENLKPEALERNDANAKLIAIAPRMLKLLKRVDGMPSLWDGEEHWAGYKSLHDDIKAAISEAV